MIVKPLSEETTLATATDVQHATVVRLVNTGSSTVVTVKDGSATVASLTLTENEVLNIQKTPTQTLVANADVLAVKVAHTN
jgi:hypothetical protein